ncbi:uncharacterized protein BT62DRAFT_925260 [Guyanagaster necrorhizus]|uniref:Uncharacterized protein n=1 Tax=Guyanagaster necrorhizus TaxID=856835 RepID=A0A9P7W513_9AGAR|nr:uncharacterized protein BT62DRAFT_925260 [Guyanagaster necrorhizus MCA 3950]KAG7452709.1 hypothetical protein BT62DRAFT_925260 [Guyanagaster necrorhizus MCA 3950]
MATCDPVWYIATSPILPFPFVDSSHCSMPVRPAQQVLPVPLYTPSPFRTRAEPKGPKKFSSLWTRFPVSGCANIPSAAAFLMICQSRV